MKILLVQPAPFEPGRLGLENVIWLSEPVALTTIAAMVDKTHQVKILDMRLEEDQVYHQTLVDFEPDLVGTTSMTTDCYQARALLHMAKSVLGDKVFTIVGGHHPTLSPGDFETDCVNALCIGEGEDTFKELVDHLDKGRSAYKLHQIHGLRYRDENGDYHNTPARAQTRDLDSFPIPSRHLLKAKYKKQYFFQFSSPMASMATSRGCAFTCDFCAIWEFYEKKVRFLSAEAIVSQMEKIEEKFIFFLDDNFLTSKSRLIKLCEEIEKRGIKKYFATQGRADFIAENPDLMKRLNKCGLWMVLSGFETNHDDVLAEMRKECNMEKNIEAARLMRKLGMVSTGIFMIRQEFDEKDFEELFDMINKMGVATPLLTIRTPLPGTELFRAKKNALLTKDTRLFDLLHSVLPTKLPRKRFYELYCSFTQKTWKSLMWGSLAVIVRKPKFFFECLPGIINYIRRYKKYKPILENPESHIRDEKGIIPVNSLLRQPQAKTKEIAKEAVLGANL